MRFVKERIKESITYGNEVEGFVFRKENNTQIFAYCIKRDMFFYMYLQQESSYSTLHSTLAECEIALNIVLKFEEELQKEGIGTQYFFKNSQNSIQNYFYQPENFLTIEEFIARVKAGYKSKVTKAKNEFVLLIEKKRHHYDEITVWDEEKIFDINMKFGFEIPADVSQSKGDKILGDILDELDELIRKKRIE